MKIHTLAALVASSLLLAACGGEKANTTEETVENPSENVSSAESSKNASLETMEQKLSYIVGTNMATQFKRDDIKLDIAAFKLAIDDVQAGTESRLSEDQIREAVTSMQAKAQEKQKMAQQAKSEENKQVGLAYLTANAKKEGVVTTESGLQYKEVVAGEGEIPTDDKTVVVHYKGTLVDGTVFDSSYERGQPAEFPVTGVIPGWVEALQLMNVGDKFELAIPSDLAYGPRGSGPKIGPDATLLFDVELIEIK